MTKVYLEIGKSKIFACAFDWPGWARSAKTEELALDALEEYAPRYRKIAGPSFKPGEFEITERITGNATTDFGAPDRIAKLDLTPVSAAKAKQMVKLLRSAWKHFDRVAAEVSAQLRKGPRGGGRDRDKVVAHTLESEASYARMIGLKTTPDSQRDEIAAVLGKPSDGQPLRPNGWPARYAARRMAWHMLDHLWEMQDKDLSAITPRK